MRLRVLIAEDHALVADQLRRLLEAECDVVEVVSDGLRLVAAVEALEPEVIVSDINMAGLDGLAAARLILHSHPSARIVFVTVHADAALARKALLAGAMGFVLKCDASEELLTAVHAAQAGRQHVSENIRSRVIRIVPS